MKATCQFTNQFTTTTHPKRPSHFTCKTRKIQILCWCCAWFSQQRRCAWCCEMPVAGRPETSRARHISRGRHPRVARVYLERGSWKIHVVFGKLDLTYPFPTLFFFLFGGPEFLRHTCNKNLDQSLGTAWVPSWNGSGKRPADWPWFVHSLRDWYMQIRWNKKDPRRCWMQPTETIEAEWMFHGPDGFMMKHQRCFSFNLVKCAWIFPIVCMLCK